MTIKQGLAATGHFGSWLALDKLEHLVRVSHRRLGRSAGQAYAKLNLHEGLKRSRYGSGHPSSSPSSRIHVPVQGGLAPFRGSGWYVDIEGGSVEWQARVVTTRSKSSDDSTSLSVEVLVFTLTVTEELSAGSDFARSRYNR